MNQFSIDRADIGYDTIGLNNFINNLNSQVIDEAINTIHQNVPSIRSAVDEIWAGQAAQVFIEKLEYESETVVQTLSIMQDLIKSNISQIGANVDEYDAAIAASIRGEEYTPSGTGMKSMMVDTGRDFSEYSSKKQEITQSIADGFNSVTNVLKRTGATVGTATFGLVEGLGKFGEAIIDTACILETVLSTSVTAIMDAGQFLFSKATGIEFHSITKGMWNSTMNFVANDYVGGAFDNLYNKTGLGNYLKDNSYGFDTTRGISSGLGYTAGVVAATIATCGAAGVAVSSTSLAATATSAGFGKGAQTAWAGGASLKDGLLYATGSGLWEGTQFYLGGQIAGVNPFSSNAANIAARVGLDALDGGVEGFVQPALDGIYKDSTYEELFAAAGSWKNVGQQAAVGAIASTIGETKNIAGVLNGQAVIDATGTVDNVIDANSEIIIDANSEIIIDEPTVKVINDPQTIAIDNETTIINNSSSSTSFVNQSSTGNAFYKMAETASQVSYTPDGKFAFDGVQGKSAFDLAVAKNPNAVAYRKFDDYISSTNAERIAWEEQLKSTFYTDPITGRTGSYEEVIRGYISEDINRPGSYKLLNTVNRAAGNTPNETLKNLLLKNENGLILDSNFNPQIEIRGCYTSLTYSIDMNGAGNVLDALVYETNNPSHGLNIDGSVGTVRDMFTRVNSETKALNDALSSSKTTSEIVIGRGCDINSLTDLYGVTPQDSAETILAKLTRDGNIYTDKGFMSSTPELGGGFMHGKKVNFIMTVKEGTTVGNFGGYNYIEQEVLLPTSSQFNIDGVTKDVNGKINIFLTQIVNGEVQ